MNGFSRLLGRFLRFVEDRSGVSTVEYALIVVAVIGIVGIGAGLLTNAFEDLFGDLATEMGGAVDAVGADVDAAEDT